MDRADIAIENLNVVPFADRLAFSRIGSLADPPTTHAVHDTVTLRIHNKGNAALEVIRTMIPDRRKERLPFGETDCRQRHKTPNDPRLTRVGKFLRRTSIDELPQLLNVVRGQMSLVGPRPELPEITERYAAWRHRRHLVRPGLTGWWQVQGRSDLPMHENTELDLYYVEHGSFRLDLRIVLRTFHILFSRKGAF